ncbi:response regulator transcription factor [Streptomyces sp. NPDC001165]|uniref:response regulator transcription factor n=1 Tax=Streptomyces sp. NPDC001165 TaxID=3364546 RepID=UPI003675BEBF
MTTASTAPTTGAALRMRVLSPRHADRVRTLARRAGLHQMAGHDSPTPTVIVNTGHPYRSIPHPVLSQVLTSGPQYGTPARTGANPALTARQTSVLRLMAEGHANADIVRLLSSSEHTVKNVIYEVMSRRQAPNRAHAVAHAVRHGLI